MCHILGDTKKDMIIEKKIKICVISELTPFPFSLIEVIVRHMRFEGCGLGTRLCAVPCSQLLQEISVFFVLPEVFFFPNSKKYVVRQLFLTCIGFGWIQQMLVVEHSGIQRKELDTVYTGLMTGKFCLLLPNCYPFPVFISFVCCECNQSRQ